MRLVIATPLYPPDPGGPATYAALLEKELPKVGIDVTLVRFDAVRHLPTLVRHLAYYHQVRRAARDADAVLALDPVSVGYPAMCAAHKEQKPFFLKIVGDYAWEQGKQRFGVTASLEEFVRTKQSSLFVRFFQYLERRVALRATKVIVPSAYLEKIVSLWGIPDEKIVVIHNAVHTDEAGMLPDSVAALPHPYVVTVARLVPWKGIGALIEAVAAARARVPGLGLVVVGEGPLRKALEARANKALRNQYVFTGALPHGDTLRVMKEADVFVLNTAYEGFSHVLLEAALVGTPIITTASGGNTELLAHEEHALLTTPENLTNDLVRLSRDAALGSRLSANALRKATDEFSVAALILKVQRVLTKA